jgi:hypothetical protein
MADDGSEWQGTISHEAAHDEHIGIVITAGLRRLHKSREISPLS